MSASFVLASASPRRRTLLEGAGYQFDVHPARIAETSNDALSFREIALCNATRKALAVATELIDQIVLAADTIVAIDGEIITKPRDMQHAISILQRLSGRTHEVCTAVFICHLAKGRRSVFCEVSRVHFHRLTTNRIRTYLAKVNPLDKAGAYAAQGSGSEIIERIEGSFTNVVGLPMEKTIAALREFGIEPRV